jgi:acyl-CoA synthetase (AMP-forming)/AMP-acid ligase II
MLLLGFLANTLEHLLLFAHGGHVSSPSCGIQVSSVELERACVEGVPCIQEAAAVGVPSPGGGPEQLVLFLVPRSPGAGASASEAKAQCQKAIRSKLNPLFKVEKVRASHGCATCPIVKLIALCGLPLW